MNMTPRYELMNTDRAIMSPQRLFLDLCVRPLEMPLVLVCSAGFDSAGSRQMTYPWGPSLLQGTSRPIRKVRLEKFGCSTRAASCSLRMTCVQKRDKSKSDHRPGISCRVSWPSRMVSTLIGRGDDTVGDPHRAQIYKFETFEFEFLNSSFASLSSY